MPINTCFAEEDHPDMTQSSRVMNSLLTAATIVCFNAAALAQAAGNGGGGGVVGVRPVRLGSGPVELTKATIRLDRDRVEGNERIILQFDAPLTAPQRVDLEASGVKLLDYLGDGSYAARIRPGTKEVPHAKWAGRLGASARKAPALNAGAFSTAQRRDLARSGKAAVAVTLFADASPEEIADTLRAVQAAPGSQLFTRELVGGNITITAQLPVAAANALSNLPAVQWVEDAPEITERDTTQRWIVQSNTPDVTPLYTAGLTGVGQILGIADSRVDFNHCAFVDSVPPGPTHRKLLAYNSTTFNFATHGTHVAGIAVGDAGAFDDNRGVAYAAKFVYSPTPSFNEDAVNTVFNLHHSQGARVHTNSWGNDATTTYDSLARGIDAFMYANEDDLVLFAVTNQAVLKNPENCKNALAVGASQDFPSQDFFCSGGVGPTTDGRRKPEVFAPGCGINAAQVGTSCSTLQLTGTSMATPAVAGIATLTRQYFTQGYYPSGAANPSDAITPSGALIKAVIVNSATDMLSYGVSVPNSNEGWGRVLADASLYLAGGSRRLIVRDVRNSAGLSTGGVVETPVLLNSSSEPLRVTLAWTEPPAAAGAVLATVNNLDLEVIAPDNTVYKGNVFAGGFSIPGGVADPINNLEQVSVNLPNPGVWTVRVKGTAINQGLQGFALALNADAAVPPRPLSIAVNQPVPSITLGNTLTQFNVTIDPGTEALVPGTARLMWRKSPTDAYNASPLFPLGGTQYRATLPRFSCADAPQFYVEAEGTTSGTATAPLGGPSASPLSLAIGSIDDTVIFSENFESGLPSGWSATGQWHVTSSCVQPSPCDPTNWAYFGDDTLCNYNVAPVRQQGTLTLPATALPPVGPGESLSLRYCSFLGREQVAGYDLARVFVNGTDVADQPSTNSTTWATRTASLSAYAGTTPTIAFDFDTIDGFVNTFTGWQVDRVEIVNTRRTCDTPSPCIADLNSDGFVNTIDLTRFLGRFGTTGEAFVTEGDLNGDGNVDTADLVKFLGAFGVPCP
jgi:hypothetical protein